MVILERKMHSVNSYYDACLYVSYLVLQFNQEKINNICLKKKERKKKRKKEMAFDLNLTNP